MSENVTRVLLYVMSIDCWYAVDCFCRPRPVVACVANVVEQQCGEEIAGHVLAMGAEMLEEAACEARKRTHTLHDALWKVESLYNALCTTSTPIHGAVLYDTC